MIGIRVDVNKIIATGHIKRDMAIALCLREMGQECLFISADENCLPYLEPHGFQSVILNSQWDDLGQELEQLQQVIEEYEIKSLLVDSYMVTEKYMQTLSEKTVVTYFDELAKFGYGCQQMINGVLVPPDYSGAKGRALLGPDYVSMRQEFVGLPPKGIRPRIEKILVTSGGTDNYHFCLKFTEAFLAEEEWKPVKLLVAVGELNGDKIELEERYGANERIELYINHQHMAELMQQADYALTAGGTTLYEVCAAGVAASCYAIADNQLEIAQDFQERGLISYAGDFRADEKGTLQRIYEQLREADSVRFREERAKKMQSLVDGKGAGRIARALVEAPEIFSV